MERYKEIERSIIKKYRKEIWSRFTKAVKDYELINENDKIMVCISGGKDSFLLAKCIQELERHGKVKFEAHYVVMDPGYNDYNRQYIIDNAKLLNIPIEIFNTDIFDVVSTVDSKSPCYLCAKMRRGHLYNRAKELGCNKIALGHHFDDVIETILMNILYTGNYASMMPKLHSDNFKGMELIRPLYFVREKDIKSWAKYNGLEFIDCACSVTKKKIGKRQEVKELVQKLNEMYKEADKCIFASSFNVNLNTVIGYKKGNEKYTFMDDYDM